MFLKLFSFCIDHLILIVSLLGGAEAVALFLHRFYLISRWWPLGVILLFITYILFLIICVIIGFMEIGQGH